MLAIAALFDFGLCYECAFLYLLMCLLYLSLLIIYDMLTVAGILVRFGLFTRCSCYIRKYFFVCINLCGLGS